MMICPKIFECDGDCIHSKPHKENSGCHGKCPEFGMSNSTVCIEYKYNENNNEFIEVDEFTV